MTPPYHILIVDDEPDFRFSASVALRQAGFRVSEAGVGGDALALLRRKRAAGDSVDLVLTDIRMPGMTGIELIEGIIRDGFDAVLCATTCFGDEELVAALARRGCREFIEKPFPPDELVTRLKALLTERGRKVAVPDGGVF